jgi:predicted Ser/Thr protein kinase
MAEKKSDRPQSDMPTQYGTASALSSSSDNIRPGYTPVPSPASDSDMATLPGVSPTPSSGAKRRPFASGQSGVGSRASSSSWDAAHGDETALEPGTVLAGRYEILDVLGKGGMGSVYKAKDQELDRLVALKVIRPELARNAAIVDRFKQELRLSHLVTHKHVIRMYDLGEDAGMRFITMEFVAGRDLRSIIEEKGKLAPVDAVGILRQICLALEAAHAVGILHRDLKPQNIMQDAAGRVVVMDFGLARTIEGDGMTQSGALVGTMEYMSPEQALGKDLDQRSDIFALGLICYEMLTGNMPFRAESALASLIKRTQERAAPISDINPTVPGALSGIIGKCQHHRDPAGPRSLGRQAGRRQPALHRQRSVGWIERTMAALRRRGPAGHSSGRLRHHVLPETVQFGDGRQGNGGANHFARHYALLQRFRRPESQLARIEPGRHVEQRHRPVAARAHGLAGSPAPGAYRPAYLWQFAGGRSRSAPAGGVYQCGNNRVWPVCAGRRPDSHRHDHP